MSVPPEVMQRMMASRQGGGQGMPTPAAAPMSAPQEKHGQRASAASNLSIAQNMLEQALVAFQPEDKEYKAILKALNALAPLAAKRDSSDLVPAEVLQMVRQLPQMGGGTDVQRAIMQQMRNSQPSPQQAAPAGA